MSSQRCLECNSHSLNTPALFPPITLIPLPNATGPISSKRDWRNILSSCIDKEVVNPSPGKINSLNDTRSPKSDIPTPVGRHAVTSRRFVNHLSPSLIFSCLEILFFVCACHLLKHWLFAELCNRRTPSPILPLFLNLILKNFHSKYDCLHPKTHKKDYSKVCAHELFVRFCSQAQLIFTKMLLLKSGDRAPKIIIFHSINKQYDGSLASSRFFFFLSATTVPQEHNSKLHCLRRLFFRPIVLVLNRSWCKRKLQPSCSQCSWICGYFIYSSLSQGFK